MRLYLLIAVIGVAVSAASLGGHSKLGEDVLKSQAVHAAAEFAVSQLNGLGQVSSKRLLFLHVDAGTQQLVSGMKYTLTLTVGESTTCAHSDTSKPVEECFSEESSPVKRLSVTVLIQAWKTEEPMKLIASAILSEAPEGDAKRHHHHPHHDKMHHDKMHHDKSHHEEHKDDKEHMEHHGHKDHHKEHHPSKQVEPVPLTASKPTMAGAATPVDDVTEADVASSIRVAIDAVNARSNSMYRLTLSRVVSATKQVVAGLKYTFTLELGESACRNDHSAKEDDECPLTASMAVTTYTVQVLSQPWKTPKFTVVSVLDGNHAVAPMPVVDPIPPPAPAQSDDYLDRAEHTLRNLPLWAYPLIGIAVGFLIVVLVALVRRCCCPPKTRIVRRTTVVQLPGQSDKKSSTHATFRRLPSEADCVKV